jgi:hypothetical protein
MIPATSASFGLGDYQPPMYQGYAVADPLSGTWSARIGSRTGHKLMLTPPGGYLAHGGVVMPASRPGHAYVALREPSNLLWAGDADRASRSSIFVSLHRPRPGRMSDRAYRFVTYSGEPLRRRSRHQGCGEHEGPSLPRWPRYGIARHGIRSQFRVLADEDRGHMNSSASGMAVVAG